MLPPPLTPRNCSFLQPFRATHENWNRIKASEAEQNFPKFLSFLHFVICSGSKDRPDCYSISQTTLSGIFFSLRWFLGYKHVGGWDFRKNDEARHPDIHMYVYVYIYKYILNRSENCEFWISKDGLRIKGTFNIGKNIYYYTFKLLFSNHTTLSVVCFRFQSVTCLAIFIEINDILYLIQWLCLNYFSNWPNILIFIYVCYSAHLYTIFFWYLYLHTRWKLLNLLNYYK